MTGSSWAEPFKWNEEQVNLLVKLWDDGLTGTEVAEAMGISRGRVLGKLNRMGYLDGSRGKSPVSIRNKVLRPPPITKAVNVRGAGRSLPPILAVPPSPPPLPEPPKSHWKGLAAWIDVLGPAECRFPLGEPCSGFCRAPTGQRRSYCDYHYYLACKKPGEPREWYEDNPKRIKGDYRQWKPLDRGT